MKRALSIALIVALSVLVLSGALHFSAPAAQAAGGLLWEVQWAHAHATPRPRVGEASTISLDLRVEAEGVYAPVTIEVFGPSGTELIGTELVCRWPGAPRRMVAHCNLTAEWTPKEQGLHSAIFWAEGGPSLIAVEGSGSCINLELDVLPPK